MNMPTRVNAPDRDDAARAPADGEGPLADPAHGRPGAAIAVRDLWLGFPGKRGLGPTPVLEGVRFEVTSGEFVCIVGPSGCGKTTLLNVVAGFLAPDRGEVVVQGEPVRGPDRRRIYIFQEGGVFPWLTVRENVGFGLDRGHGEDHEALIRHYIEMVGLAGFDRAYPRELSGGMRQRVELARGLAADPDILYMDEPFGALDFITRLKMRADLIRIWEAERKTVLFVTHDIDEAIQLADRILVMSRRPATICDDIPVDLTRPRALASPAYLHCREQVFRSMGVSPDEGTS